MTDTTASVEPVAPATSEDAAAPPDVVGTIAPELRERLNAWVDQGGVLSKGCQNITLGPDTPGTTVTPHYDSLMAKLILFGADRADAIAKARAAGVIAVAPSSNDFGTS